MIAGRPFALDRFCEDLFAGYDWRLARIECFTKQEQEQYLGSERFELLMYMDVELLAVPRALEAIRAIDAGRLQEVRTASDVYWRSIESMLAKAATPELTRCGYRDETVLWLLGALAFQMVLEGNFEGVPEGEYGKFIGRIWDRQQTNCRFGTFDGFVARLEMLGQTNEFLDHGFLEGRGMKQVFWRNRTFQEFFAGLWMAKFASAQDCGEMAERLYLAHDLGTQDYYWVWRFAAEMPPACRAAECWVAAMRPLYQPGDGTAAGTRRSTEMIYRSWQTVNYALRRARHRRKCCAKHTLKNYSPHIRTNFRRLFSVSGGTTASPRTGGQAISWPSS